MSIEDAKQAADEITKLKTPRSYAKRDEVVAELQSTLEEVESFREEVQGKVEALNELVTELDEKVDGLKELIDMLEDGERSEFSEQADNIRTAAEEVRDLLT